MELLERKISVSQKQRKGSAAKIHVDKLNNG